MEGNGQITRLLNRRQGGPDAHIRRVALRRSSQIDRSLGQRDAPFRPAYLHHGIEGGIGQEQRVGIGQADVFCGADDESAGNELRVFPTLYHACHPVECCIGVAAANALDEGRDDVVMHLAVFVVGQRILLQACLDEFVGNNDGLCRLRLYHEFQNVQQLACIAAAISEHRSRLLQLDVQLRELGVGGNGAMQQCQQVVFLERLQHIELATREQRANHLERRVLCSGTDERDDTPLHSSQQRVLLRLRETVYLVDEQNGRCRREEAVLLCPLYHIAHVLHATGHSR